ncbi:MerR family transcriptional regulator, partial [Microgenomates group bacterium]|nr:MerR family transcriptional regulator [Microgenomates group bacterium]
MKNLITAGELAKLACITKRTILFYDEKGVLRPQRINEKKYRFYSQRQVLDYQMILLLTTLGVSLNEIKKSLGKRNSLTPLFNTKKALIQKEINLLQFNLKNLEKFLNNLKINKTLVNPQIKTLQPFGVYYVTKIGAYSQIDQFCRELLGIFKSKQNLTTMAIFEQQGYRPKKSRIKIGVLAKKGLVIKDDCKNKV